MTDYIYRIIMVVVPANKAAIAGMISDYTQQNADILTFNAPLSASGNNPVTHYGACTSANQAYWDSLNANLPIADFAYTVVDNNNAYIQGNVANPPAIGSLYKWADMLTGMNLKPISHNMVAA